MKTITTILATMFLSTAAMANVPMRSIDETTIVTKDSMIVLDKRERTFWKLDYNCKLPISTESNVKFLTNERMLRKGSKVSFKIDDKDPHKCLIVKVSSL